MKLEGSCHCGAVRFRLESSEPCPFTRCYCSICRKTAGSGGYAINLGGDHRTLEVLQGSARDLDLSGASARRVRRQRRDQPGAAALLSPLRQRAVGLRPALAFARASAASAIDTPLPAPAASDHIMLGSKANWALPQLRDGDRSFDEYPDESLAEWHRRHGLG